MLDYDFPLYRPPAEANSIILQATYGCSHNQCTFCSMYKTKKYKIRPLETLQDEITMLAVQFPDATKVFLGDGDALALPFEHLKAILDMLGKAFVKLRRVSAYATAQNLLEKSQDELNHLQAHKLSLLYFGVETGNETLLQRIMKGVDANEMIRALDKAKHANMKTSVTVILGLGGKHHSDNHIHDTAQLINHTQVTYLSTLQLGLESSIKEHFMTHMEDFVPLTDMEVLQEQQLFIQQLSPTNKVIFRSNHASNALPLKGTLPKDKARLLNEISWALNTGEEALIPKRFRGF